MATSAKRRGSWPRAIDMTPQRVGHVGVGDAQHGRGRRLDVEPERVSHRALDRGHAPGRGRAARGRPGACGRRASRARRARRSRSRPRRPARRRPGPGSAPALAGPTRSAPKASTLAIEPPPAPMQSDVDLRQVDRHPGGLAGEAHLRLAADHEADVGGRAAHVEGQRRRARRPRRPAAPPPITPAAGPDDDERDRQLPRALGRRHAAVGLHQVQRHPHALARRPRRRRRRRTRRAAAAAPR